METKVSRNGNLQPLCSQRGSLGLGLGLGGLIPTMGFKAKEEGPLVNSQVDTYLLTIELICGLPLVSFLGQE